MYPAMALQSAFGDRELARFMIISSRWLRGFLTGPPVSFAGCQTYPVDSVSPWELLGAKQMERAFGIRT